MKMKLFSLFKPGDFIMIAAALCLAVFFIMSARSGGGQIKHLELIHGEEIIPLSWENSTFSIYELTKKQMIVEIKNGKARVTHSSCPDKLCVKSGWIFECGHIAACLPNNIALMVNCKNVDYKKDLNVTESK